MLHEVVYWHSSCLEFRNFSMFFRLKTLPIWRQKKFTFKIHFQISVLLEIWQYNKFITSSSLKRLRLERCFSYDLRSISRNVASLNILVHDVWTCYNYQQWTKKQKCFYIYGSFMFGRTQWQFLRNKRNEISEW